MIANKAPEILTLKSLQGSKNLAPEDLVIIIKALSDVLRLQILFVLKSDSFSVTELCAIFQLAQPKLSHHLKVMASAGLVATRREGNSIFYRRRLLDITCAKDSFVRAFLTHVDNMQITTSIVDHIDKIKSHRAQTSLNFFSKNVNNFGENQALICEYDQFASNLIDLLNMSHLHSSAKAIEVGAGEGGFLVELASRFSHVTAIDNSSPMLRLAEQSASSVGATNIDFLLGDIREAHKIPVQADLVALIMVLHHIPSPAIALIQAAKLIKGPGFLLIAELCHHDQDWVKDSCGDLWQGFESEEINHWASIANLDHLQCLYLGMRNGFQVQLHLFQKKLH